MCMGVRGREGLMDPGGGSCHVPLRNINQYRLLQGGRRTAMTCETTDSLGTSPKERKKTCGHHVIQLGKNSRLKGCKKIVNLWKGARRVSMRDILTSSRLTRYSLKKISSCRGRWLDGTFRRYNTGQLHSETALTPLWGCGKIDN